jgi:ubiquinone/menaquinone biosynthesis C-methylase UbiE/uncharacterized protein YbaR (Trm112 family)
MMSFIEPEILNCPSCQGDIKKTNNGLICEFCGTEIIHQDGVFNLLPDKLSQTKINEDQIFSEKGEEYLRIKDRPWLNIVSRQHALNILRFDEELVDDLPKGRFLEIGGETCYISSIYKSVYPQSIVYATDVSINALKNLAIPTSQFFPHAPDVFAAVDAEDLPFKDSTFDIIFAMTMIHHLPHPESMLNEVHRILKPGGVFIAIDHCVPKHFRWLFSKAADDRAKKYGIKEDLISYNRWLDIFRGSSFPSESLQIYRNPAYQPNPIIALAGRIISLLPVNISKHLFPVGVQIMYTKTE